MVEFIETTTFSVALITFGTAPLCKEIIKIFLVRRSVGMVFPYNANAFAELMLVAHRSLLANTQARFFCAILIFYNLTKKRLGGILKEMEMPDSVGRLHSVVNKAATVSRKGGFTF